MYCNLSKYIKLDRPDDHGIINKVDRLVERSRGL